MSYYDDFRERQKRIEERHASGIYLAVKAQYRFILKVAKERGIGYAQTVTIDPTGIVNKIKRLYREAAWIEAKYQYSSLIKRREKRASFGIGFDSLAGIVDEYFRLYQFNKSGFPISETTKEDVIRGLADRVDAGMDLNQAVKDYSDIALTGGTSKARNRAQAIIATESIRAMSFGGLYGAYMTGIDLDKVWVTSADEKVRGTSTYARYPHNVLDRQVAPMFGKFQNGEQIKFPGDPDASIENTARCRCTVFYKQRSRKRVERNSRNFLIDFFRGFVMGIDIALLTNEYATSEETD